MLIFVSVGLLLELKNNILRIYDLIKTTWMFQNNLHVEKKKKNGQSQALQQETAVEEVHHPSHLH